MVVVSIKKYLQADGLRHKSAYDSNGVDIFYEMDKWLNENAGKDLWWWNSVGAAGWPSVIEIVDDEISVLFKLKFEL